jgi:uncharacterized protein (TIGR00369 family)
MTNEEILARLNQLGPGHLPGLLGIEIVGIEPGVLISRLGVRQDLMAPNDYLHAGTVTALADTTAGYGTMANLPEGGIGFTTIELKCNFLGSVREGLVFFLPGNGGPSRPDYPGVGCAGLCRRNG